MIIEWHKLGVENGDRLLIQGNLGRLFARSGYKSKTHFFDAFIEEILSQVGSGAVCFPVFNFDFYSGGKFDFQETKSQMGSHTNYYKLKPYFHRSMHPIYGFISSDADLLSQSDDSYYCFGEKSVFDALALVQAKQIVVGLPDAKSMTLYHHAEKLAGASHREEKQFSGKYVLNKSSIVDYRCSSYVRKSGVQTQVEPIERLMWQKIYGKEISGIKVTGLDYVTSMTS